MINESVLQKFKALYELFPDLICTLDTAGRIIDCNSHIIKFFGYKKEEAMGRSCLDFISQEYRKQTLAGLEIAKKEGFGKGTEILFIRRDGTKFFGLARSARLTDDSGQFTGYLVSIKDATKLHDFIQEGLNREHAIREELERSIQLQTAKEKIIVGIRNELVNDLTPLNANIEMLLSGLFGEVSQEQRKRLEDSQVCIKQLSRRLSMMSDIARFELGNSDSERQNMAGRLMPTDGLDPLNINRLRVQAGLENKSMDEILNRIVNYYFIWHDKFDDSEYIQTSKYLTKKLFESLTDDNIIEISKSHAREKLNRLIKAAEGTVNHDAALTFLKKRAETSGFEFLQYRKNEFLKVSITHRMGFKYSFFFMSVWRNLLNDIGCEVDSDFSEDSVILSIYDPIKLE